MEEEIDALLSQKDCDQLLLSLDLANFDPLLEYSNSTPSSSCVLESAPLPVPTSSQSHPCPAIAPALKRWLQTQMWKKLRRKLFLRILRRIPAGLSISGSSGVHTDTRHALPTLIGQLTSWQHIQLRLLGLGVKKRQAEPITTEEEDLLWEKVLLGDCSPQALLDTMHTFPVWYSFCPAQWKRAP